MADEQSGFWSVGCDRDRILRDLWTREELREMFDGTGVIGKLQPADEPRRPTSLEVFVQPRLLLFCEFLIADELHQPTNPGNPPRNAMRRKISNDKAQRTPRSRIPRERSRTRNNFAGLTATVS
jgi:hypothetical protein